MTKDSDKFVKGMKASKKMIADLSFAATDKKQKAMMAHLEKTWDAEDALQAGIQKARAAGVTSKRFKDFAGHEDVVKPLKAWQAMLKGHHTNLKDLQKHCELVKTFTADLTKSVDTVEKGLKKSSGMGDMEAMALVKTTKSKTLPDLKKSQEAYALLKSFVIMYGTNINATMTAIVKDAIAAVTPKEFPASLGEDKRRKTTKDLKNIPAALEKLCKVARNALEEGKPDVAEAALGKAEKEFDTIASYAKDAKTTVSKMKKELKEHKDSKIITKMISVINKTHKDWIKKLDELEKEIEAKQKELQT